MYIPEGFGAVFPYFIVEGAERFAEFLKDAFHAREIGRTVLPNGRIANIRIRVLTSTFMVSEAGEDGLVAMKSANYVYTENVDETFERALSLGATKMFDPRDMPYEDRQGGIVDPFGNIWWISRRLVEKSYDA